MVDPIRRKIFVQILQVLIFNDSWLVGGNVSFANEVFIFFRIRSSSSTVSKHSRCGNVLNTEGTYFIKPSFCKNNTYFAHKIIFANYFNLRKVRWMTTKQQVLQTRYVFCYYNY